MIPPLKRCRRFRSELSAEGSKLFRDHDHFTYGRPVFKVDSSVTVSSVPAPEDLSQSNASAAAVGFGSEKFPSELIKGASPFRLLQDYASDDSSEDDVKPCLEEVGPVTASISTTAGATSLNGEILSNLQMDQGLMSVSSSEMAFGTFSKSSQRTAREADVTSIATVKTEELVENNSRNQESIDNAVSPEVLQLKDTVDGVLDAAPDSGKSHSQKEDFKYASTLPKVDEFGRLVREGASDSDSEDPHYTRRRGKRGRSWSRSQSPHDRRRRSPRRGKEKRSRSRSLSPKKRRSRSRSPSYGHGGEFVGHKMRWDKGQLPECLDFLRGRCHRGAFCRYFHPDSNKNNSGSRNRSKKQYVEVPTVSRTSDFHEEIDKTPPKRSVHQKDMPGDSVGVLRDGKLDWEQVLVSVQDAVQTIISDQDDKSLITDVVLSERSIEVTAIVQQTQIIKEEILESSTVLPDNQNCLEIMGTVHPVVGSPSRLTDAGAPKSPGDTTCGVASSIENLVMPQSQANPSLPVLHNADHRPQHVDGSSTSDSSPLQMSSTLQSQLPVSEPHLNKISSVQSYPVLNVPPAILLRFLREHRSEWADSSIDAYSAAAVKVGPCSLPGSRVGSFSGQVILPLAHTIEHEELLEVIKLEGVGHCPEDAIMPRDMFLLQLWSGMDENAVGTCAELIFAPMDASFADDAPLLPSGFRIIPLDSGKEASSPNRTLDLASALEIGLGGNKASNDYTSNGGSTRSVMTIAFEFAFEVAKKKMVELVHKIIEAKRKNRGRSEVAKDVADVLLNDASEELNDYLLSDVFNISHISVLFIPF
ncbi:unnamed protein product [Camellia sinensis]